MDFQYDFGTAIAGFFIALAGGALVVFYRPFSDHLANGLSSYDKVKRWGIIITFVGLLMISNLHLVVLTWIFNLLLGR